MNTRLLCLALALSAAAVPATAAEWAVDPAKSTIKFSGVQVGAPFTGRFERFQAKIDFDPAKPEAGHAVVLIDLASARTGDVQRDEALPQKDWFDVKGANQARFEATRFIDKGHGDYEAVGTLTIRGTRAGRSRCPSISRSKRIRRGPPATSALSEPTSVSARARGHRASGSVSTSGSTSTSRPRSSPRPLTAADRFYSSGALA